MDAGGSKVSRLEVLSEGSKQLRVPCKYRSVTPLVFACDDCIAVGVEHGLIFLKILQWFL